MYITSLELKNFRNYTGLSIEFDKKLNLIVGRNAQGKTNLIESLYLSSIGRSFRTSQDKDLIKFGENTAYIKVSAEKEFIDTTVEISIDRTYKKSVKKDGSFIRKISLLLDNIIIVIFSPEDLKIVKDEPEKRRRFIDRELSQIKPSYFNNLESYRKALIQRNAYLKEEKVERDMLLLWDEQLIQYGANVIKERKEFIDKLNEYSSAIHGKITNGREKLELVYDPNISYSDDIKVIQENIRKELNESYQNDLRIRTTGKGPHKDDLLFMIDGVNARNFGSQGQQRTCALSLKLAELDLIREETGEEGILLMDDVMSELDENRREYLVRALSNNQIFITSTEVDDGIMMAYPDVKIIEIDDGLVISE